MWLLNVNTRELKEFTTSEGIPPYAILSHRWGAKDDEISWRDMFRFGRHSNKVCAPPAPEKVERCVRVTDKKAWPKVDTCCKMAKQEGLDWVWIDTCCINKSSSAALAEAINSMFRWYRDASKCIVYLHDIPSNKGPDGAFPEDAFRCASWFRRGWTLQELIAPSEALFFAQDWTLLGTKETLLTMIEEITNIDANVLLHQDLLSVSVAKIMSWAANRQTEKIEDRAYSLAGLFGVTITPVYGEREAAFKRLQIEIMKVSNDQSLFAWSFPWHESPDMPIDPATPDGSILAPSPDYFCHSSRVVSVNYEEYQKAYHFSGPIEDYTMTNQGLRIHLPIVVQSTHRSLIEGAIRAAGSWKHHHYQDAENAIWESISDVHMPSSGAWAKHRVIYACLACRFEDGDKSFVSIVLTRQPSGQYKRLYLDGGMESLRTNRIHKSHCYGSHMGTIYVWEDQQTLQDLLRKRSPSMDSATGASVNSCMSTEDSVITRIESTQSSTSSIDVVDQATYTSSVVHPPSVIDVEIPDAGEILMLLSPVVTYVYSVPVEFESVLQNLANVTVTVAASA